MYRNNKIVAVIPAYNEEKLIGKVIQKMPAFIDNMIIINDGSHDKTEDAIIKTGDNRVIYIKNENNIGVGGSVCKGAEKAKKIKADIIVTMAGDDQCDPKYLPKLLDPIIEDKCDFTKGNRFFSRDSLHGMPFHRIFGSIVLSFMNKIASGYWSIFDPQNGYSAQSFRAFEKIDFNRITKRFAYENDLLINLNIIDARVKDIPIPALYGEEASSMKIWKIVPSFSWFLFKGFFRRIFRKYVIRGFHPIFLFFFFGTIFTSWGLIFGLVSWKHSHFSGVITNTGTV
ncbi:glycosyl transferase, partial [bacterium (Candidatus Howlettbacteria) CG23_combo_of_CG06-09_8_20_14_all_37_9]